MGFRNQKARFLDKLLRSMLLRSIDPSTLVGITIESGRDLSAEFILSLPKDLDDMRWDFATLVPF